MGWENPFDLGGLGALLRPALPGEVRVLGRGCQAWRGDLRVGRGVRGWPVSPPGDEGLLRSGCIATENISQKIA